MSMSEAVSHSDMSPCRKAKRRARHPGTHLYTGYRDFSCRQSFVWLRNTALWKLLTTFPISKREMGLWWHQCAPNRQKAGAGCTKKKKKKEQNIFSLVKQSMEAAPRSAVEYQEKCQQLHSEWVTSFRKDTASITSPAPSYSQPDHPQGPWPSQDLSGRVWLLSFSGAVSILGGCKVFVLDQLQVFMKS